MSVLNLFGTGKSKAYGSVPSNVTWERNRRWEQRTHSSLKEALRKVAPEMRKNALELAKSKLFRSSSSFSNNKFFEAFKKVNGYNKANELKKKALMTDLKGKYTPDEYAKNIRRANVSSGEMSPEQIARNLQGRRKQTADDYNDQFDSAAHNREVRRYAPIASIFSRGRGSAQSLGLSQNNSQFALNLVKKGPNDSRSRITANQSQTAPVFGVSGEKPPETRPSIGTAGSGEADAYRSKKAA